MSGQSIILAMALAVPMVLAQAQPTRSSSSASSNAIQPEAWQIVVLANQARAEAGAGPLKWDAALAAAARKHCLRMVAEGPIAHRYDDEPDVSERAAQAGAHFSLIEENVAIAPTPEAIHDGWMHSRDHRENLLNPAVDRVGIAVVASRDVLYAVADYERAVPVLSQAEVEATVAALVRVSGIAILQNPADARAACSVDSGLPSSKSILQPLFVMRWQGSDLTRLPQKLIEKLASGNYHKAAIGSCPTQEQEGPFTSYRIAVLLY